MIRDHDSVDARYCCLSLWCNLCELCPSHLPRTSPPQCSTHTACSSSLVATHLAHTGLLNGEAQAAAACGIFMVLLPGTMSGISQLQVGTQAYCI